MAQGIIGTVVDLIYRSEETGYTVAIVENDDFQITAVGYFPFITVGRRYALEGNFKVHAKYGEQFAVSHSEELVPEKEDEIVAFLSSGAIRGIREKLAKTIVGKFGKNTLKILDKDPKKLLDIKGVGPKTYKMIVESYNEQRGIAKLSIKLQKYGLSAKQAIKLINEQGNAIVNLIKKNPYLLVEKVRGFGFIKADKIGLKMGIAHNDSRRVESCIFYLLDKFSRDGNTFVPKIVLGDQCCDLLDISREDFDDSILSMAVNGRLRLDDIEGEEVVYLFPYYIVEKAVAHRLNQLFTSNLKPLNLDLESLVKMYQEENGISLSENQREAIIKSIEEGIAVITGGPGTGKTTIINTIIKIYEHAGCKVAICAPTGRAAKRIEETSSHSAKTIHRLLEYSPSGKEDVLYFGKNEDDPLDYDVIIVDEASMIDIFLMDSLLKATKLGTRLLLVGDADQLPSVGAGNVLRDIIESQLIYTKKLNEIFRQGKESLIVVNAHRINNGEFPITKAENPDFFFMNRDSEEKVLDVLVQLVTARLPEYYNLEDKLKDIQVLTAVKKGNLGTNNLNAVLQQSLNPPSKEKAEKKFGDRIFRTGDKIMQIKNNYEIKWRKVTDFSEGSGIFNGDLGIIQSVNNEEGCVNILFDDDKILTYDFSQLEQIELAYAVTVHKSQGSEFKVMVMPITWFPPMLATRNLLYTAVTRGKKVVVLVGMENRLSSMINNNRITLRFSGLKSRLEFYKKLNEELSS